MFHPRIATDFDFHLLFAGLLTCLNHEDCLGANRYCHRNRTMTSGVCACNPGYKQAKDSAVKCLSVGECKQARGHLEKRKEGRVGGANKNFFFYSNKMIHRRSEHKSV